MFDLKESVRKWNRSFRGKCSAEDQEELESHLLEIFEDLKESGLTEEEAFKQAAARIGSPADVGREFARVRSTNDRVMDRLRALDLQLFLGLLLICCMGLALVYSVGHGVDAEPYLSAIWIKQMIWIGLGFIIMLIVAQVKPARLMWYTPLIYGTSIFLLILVLFLGSQTFGTHRWIHLGFLTIQPSVLMLLTIPMIIAWLLTKPDWSKTWKGFATMLTVIFLPAILILYQPDFGMAMLCLAAGWMTLFNSECRARLLKFTCVALPLLCAAVWFLLPRRMSVFLNPELPDGYMYIQMRLAIKSGGIFGHGWLKTADALPEQHTDFILSALVAQFGIAGAFVLLICFAFVLCRTIIISKRSQDIFCRALGLGFSGVILIQLAVNVCMHRGLLPLVGLPLPLVSYGGSSLVLLLAGFGIMSSIHHQEQLKPHLKTG